MASPPAPAASSGLHPHPPPPCTALVPFSLASPFADALRLEWRDITLGGRRFRIRQAHRDDGRGGTALGFGASVYACSVVLAHYVLEHPCEFAGSGSGAGGDAGGAVVELGAGLALGSMAVAAVGGRAVATDGDDLVVGYARSNLDANGCGGVPSARLLWGDDGDTARVLEQARALGGGVRCVVAADVVAAPYAAHFPGLVATVAALLRGGGGGGGEGCADAPPPTFLLAYQRRHSDEDAFFAAMASAGFVAAPLPREAVHPDFRRELRPVQLLRFTLAGVPAGADGLRPGGQQPGKLGHLAP